MFMKNNPPSNGVAARRVTVKGKRMVVLEEADFDRLMRKADEFEPLLPDPLPNGNYPAGEYLRVSLAIKIIRHRRRLGLSQAELARRAGIRPESLNRIEQGHVTPSIRTVERIDKALRKAEAVS
jgi:DNA-binding XRE family transcriptional regulator